MLLENGAGEPLALPHRVVAVLDRKLRQHRLAPVAVRAVERVQLAGEHADGPAVGGDVMDVEEQDVVVFGQLEEDDAQARLHGEVERADRLVAHERADAACLRVGRQRGEVDHRKIERARLDDHLHRLVVFLAVDGTQDGVARDDGFERAAQPLVRHRPDEPQRRGDVVAGTPFLQP